MMTDLIPRSAAQNWRRSSVESENLEAAKALLGYALRRHSDIVDHRWSGMPTDGCDFQMSLLVGGLDQLANQFPVD